MRAAAVRFAPHFLCSLGLQPVDVGVTVRWTESGWTESAYSRQSSDMVILDPVELTVDVNPTVALLVAMTHTTDRKKGVCHLLGPQSLASSVLLRLGSWSLAGGGHSSHDGQEAEEEEEIGD